MNITVIVRQIEKLVKTAHAPIVLFRRNVTNEPDKLEKSFLWRTKAPYKNSRMSKSRHNRICDNKVITNLTKSIVLFRRNVINEPVRLESSILS